MRDNDTQRPNVLVLGSTGMLGSMIYLYLSGLPSLRVSGTSRHSDAPSVGQIYFEAEKFLKGEEIQDLFEYDYIVNCIGITKPHCQDTDQAGVLRATRINALFPRELSNYLHEGKTRIIHIATDAVYSGSRGNYDESAAHDCLDVYGKTKSLGEMRAHNFLNIRTSIVGPELKSSSSLLAWFLSQPKASKIKGFTNYYWNGVTTLQFAKLCELIIVKDLWQELLSLNHVHHFVPNKALSKFELLQCFNTVFNREITIEPVESPNGSANRVLASCYSVFERVFGSHNLPDATLDLKQFMARHYS